MCTTMEKKWILQTAQAVDDRTNRINQAQPLCCLLFCHQTSGYLRRHGVGVLTYLPTGRGVVSGERVCTEIYSFQRLQRGSNGWQICYLGKQSVKFCIYTSLAYTPFCLSQLHELPSWCSSEFGARYPFLQQLSIYFDSGMSGSSSVLQAVVVLNKAIDMDYINLYIPTPTRLRLPAIHPSIAPAFIVHPSFFTSSHYLLPEGFIFCSPQRIYL